MLRKVAGLLLALSSLIGCALFAPSSATHLLNRGMFYPPISPEAVTIYSQQPDFEYVVVGVIEARGESFSNAAKAQERATRALIKDAASIGANGVIITESREAHTGGYMANAWGIGILRHIKGTAIRRP